MSWNYRIFRHWHPDGSVTYALHEAYYDKKGRCNGWTVNAMSQHYETAVELLHVLRMMVADAERSYEHVLEYEYTKRRLPPDRTTKKTRKNEARKGKKAGRRQRVGSKTT